MSASNTCRDPQCGGTVLADGWCDTCGLAAGTGAVASSSTGSAGAAPSRAGDDAGGRASARPHAVDFSLVGNRCAEPGCGGTVLGDGYCNTCGARATAPQPVASPPAATGAASAAPPGGAASGRAASSATGPIPAAPSMAAPISPTLSTRVSQQVASTEKRRTTASRRAGQQQTGLGLGLVDVARTDAGDPAQALMSPEKIATVLGAVPEDRRQCTSCGQLVGQSRDGEAGRTTGFCGNCRTPFDFITNAPSLQAGDLVANQYEILGPLAHGGMGWIYLGRDTAVSNRWVVLKGLLNEDDADAVESAVAERQFLAQVEHGNIVDIYNFVTWGGAGYIVMEYVGGESLNSKLKAVRRASGGTDSLELTQALAYMGAVLPALGYLHDLGLVYNDLKPANVMATGDDVKLIDVGGVMQIEDHEAAIFGTQGFQAPEVASAGPSVASDLYTVGRTLAVLSMAFPFHTGPWEHELPPASDQPLLARWESFHRLLLKATAPHPDDRFQSAGLMRAQLRGVLREIVAATTGTPRPTVSVHFGGDQLTDLLVDDRSAATSPSWRSLPRPRVIATDPAASFLLDLPEDDPVRAAGLLEAAVADKRVEWTHETAFVSAQLAFEAGGDPTVYLDSLGAADPWDWRIRWIKGLHAMKQNQPSEAAELFSQVWTYLPGEIAPKIAVALAAESAGDHERAASLYDQIVTTDPTWVTASFGLARCRAARRDRAGAVDAYRRVPASSAGYFDAQVAAAHTLVNPIEGSAPTLQDIAAAARTVEQVQLDSIERAEVSARILEQALAGVESGTIQPDKQTRLFGSRVDEQGLRKGLERTYRELARVAPTRAARIELVNRANDVRPRSLW